MSRATRNLSVGAVVEAGIAVTTLPGGEVRTLRTLAPAAQTGQRLGSPGSARGLSPGPHGRDSWPGLVAGTHDRAPTWATARAASRHPARSAASGSPPS